MDMTTTDKNWLKQWTTQTKAAMVDALKIRKKDYEGYEPPEVKERRAMNDKLHEHDSLFTGLFKQMTASFGGLMRLDEKLKDKK